MTKNSGKRGKFEHDLRIKKIIHHRVYACSWLVYSLRLRCSQLNVLIFGAYSKLNILNFSVHWIYMIWKAPYIDRRRQFVESLKKARSADRVLIPKSPSTRRHISAGNPLSGLLLSRSVAHPRVPTGIWGRTSLSGFSHFFLGSPQTSSLLTHVSPYCCDVQTFAVAS